ncbi:MAG: SdrD B-like domain-containing protein [Parcubacteria group bacterium]|jgi:hypothetical protein
MKKLFFTALLLLSTGFTSAQAATTVTFGSSAKMFAPNCFCKEDVVPYHLATYCGAKNSCNGETGTQTINVAEGRYKVQVNVGSLTDSQKYEVVIVNINGQDYTVPDLGGNKTSTGTATYNLGTLNLSGNVTFKAHHKYANIFTGKWYAENYTQIGSGDAMESIIIDSVTLQAEAPAPINGTCGNRTATYPATTTNWLTNSSFCSTGTVSPANPIFPAQGATTDWTCVGSNGGSTATCHATRGSVVPTPTPTPTPTPEPEEENHECKGEIGNYIWLDSNGDGQQDESEQGLAGIRVKLTNLTNDDTSTLYTTKNGKYEFHDLCEGKYVVNVKEKDVEQYTQTYDPDGTKNNKTDVKLDSDRDSHMKADFGYKGKRVAPATGSGNLAIYLAALITLIAMSTYIRVRARKLAQQK